MPIEFYEEDIDFKLDNQDEITNWILDVIEKENFAEGDITIIFCSDTYLLHINKKFLSHDYFTDVITFDYTDGETVSGDIFISIDRVMENSANFSKSFEDELHRVIIHGILHLTGHKDKSDKDEKAMRVTENKYLKILVPYL